MPRFRRKPKIAHYLIAIAVAALFGVGSAFLFTEGVEVVFKDRGQIDLVASVGNPLSWFKNRFNGVAHYQAKKPAAKPLQYHYQIDSSKSLPEISAKAYLVADIETGERLVIKNADAVLPLASITKLITVLTAEEKLNQFQTAVVSSEAVETYSEAGSLKVGERLPTSELVYPLLLESSNDAAEVIAYHAGRADFIDEMNQKAQAIGLTQTVLTDPSGISAGNISTVNDLFVLAKYLFDYKKDLLALTRMRDHSFANHRWVNANEFVKDERFVGGKNGHTTAAAATFVGLFDLPLGETATRTVAVIVLGSNDRIVDTNKLLNYLTNSVHWVVKPEEAKLEIESVKATTTMVFVGDIMLDRGVGRSIERNGDGDYDYAFHRSAFLREADIAFANLEGPISDKGVDRHHLYSFRMNPLAAQAIASSGIDVVSFANNHVGDWGVEAFVDTLDWLTVAGVVYTGAGKNNTLASAPVIVERNGLKFGFVGFSDVGPDWLEATTNQPGILIAQEELVARVVSDAAKQVDVLITSFHFGNEYQALPSARQKVLAKLAIDNGSKIVVGHHPHVVQPLEYYQDGVIAYSLGNFIFDQYFSAETMRGGALFVEWSDGKLATARLATTTLNSQFIPALSE